MNRPGTTPLATARRRLNLSQGNKVAKISQRHILMGMLAIGGSLIVIQLTLVQRVMSNVETTTSEPGVIAQNYDDAEVSQRKMEEVFKQPDGPVHYIGGNSSYALPTHTSPIPDVKSETSGALLYNPEEFRTGDRTKYVNRPVECVDCDQRVNQLLGQPIPAPTGLRHQATPKGNDVILAVHHENYKLNKRDLTWLIGSLRRTGYDGHIILGVHPEITDDVEQLLKTWDVTMYNVNLGTCEGTAGSRTDGRGRPVQCYEGESTNKLPSEWGRYELTRQWLHACESCTGKALVLFDSKMAFFQSNPFTHMTLDGKTDLLLSEELGPHTDPYYGSMYFPNRHFKLSGNGGYSGSTYGCYGDDHDKAFGENRPVLVSRTAFGTKDGLHRYLSVLSNEFRMNVDQQACHYPRISDTWTMNYLYYSGKLGKAEQTKTLPWGTGFAMAIGRPCYNQYKQPNHSHLDIVEIDYEETGSIVNNFETKDSPLRVVPLVRQFMECEKWIKMFIKEHNEINGKTDPRPDGYLSILEHSISQSIKILPKSEKPHPMETSYQRATVVQQASWFPHQKVCLQTCCAQAIAISLDQDSEHLITSVDGMDLADVSLIGHSKKAYLDFAVSDLTDAIIPCLRSGTIIYADHEGGGFKRFQDYYRPKMTKPYVLITGGTDGIEPWAPKDIGRKMLSTDKLLINWYGINACYRCGADLPKFQMMFLGLSAGFDHQKHLSVYQRATNFTNPFSGENKKRWTESHDLATATDTSHLIFVKFGINAHSLHRQEPFDMACNGLNTPPMDDISCSHSKRKYHSTEIYDAARHYPFGLSPPGNGRDCYRTYELLYLGIIPIVYYREEYAELYKGLPIVQLKNWKHTQEELVQILQDYVASPEFQDNEFEGWNKLFLSHWRHRVLYDTGRMSEIVKDDQGREYYKAWTYTRYTPPYTKTYWPPQAGMEAVQSML